MIIFLSLLFTLPNVGLTLPGIYNPNAYGSDAFRGSNRLRTRILDRYTWVSLPECVVSTMSGSPRSTPETTQEEHRQRIDIKSQDRN